MYWKLEERIMPEEQGGKERAEYGTKLLQHLADNMEAEFGSGFSHRQLAFCRQFYNTYRNMNALRSQFNWYQYRLLIQISDNDKREYYELETANTNWTGRESVGLYLDWRPDQSRYDNDLKYRYVLMKGEASPKRLSELEVLFETERDQRRIDSMRRDVEKYERLVRKRAALDEQARLKAQEAEQLKRDAAKLKNK